MHQLCRTRQQRPQQEISKSKVHCHALKPFGSQLLLCQTPVLLAQQHLCQHLSKLNLRLQSAWSTSVQGQSESAVCLLQDMAQSYTEALHVLRAMAANTSEDTASQHKAAHASIILSDAAYSSEAEVHPALPACTPILAKINAAHRTQQQSASNAAHMHITHVHS